jgi:hypothetical protein
MVLTPLIPLRAIYRLAHYITGRHLRHMATVMLATGLFVAYGYGIELFMAWYSGNVYEWGHTLTRLLGPYAPFYWARPDRARTRCARVRVAFVVGTVRRWRDDDGGAPFGRPLDPVRDARASPVPAGGRKYVPARGGGGPGI